MRRPLAAAAGGGAGRGERAGGARVCRPRAAGPGARRGLRPGQGHQAAGHALPALLAPRAALAAALLPAPRGEVTPNCPKLQTPRSRGSASMHCPEIPAREEVPQCTVW